MAQLGITNPKICATQLTHDEKGVNPPPSPFTSPLELPFGAVDTLMGILCLLGDIISESCPEELSSHTLEKPCRSAALVFQSFKNSLTGVSSEKETHPL
jgi:hypothetical protein